MKVPRFIRVFAVALAFALPACHRERASELEIDGSVQFSNQVHQALALLKQRDVTAYAMVTNYIRRIQEGERSGMWAYRNPPTYEMSGATALHSLTWCAATIAHDSFHSKLYHEYKKASGEPVPDLVWTGQAAEQQCMEHQLAVMQRIGASQWEINYARTQARGHYVKDNEDWQDYKRRKW